MVVMQCRQFACSIRYYFKSIFDLSDVDVVDHYKYGMSFKKIFRYGARSCCHQSELYNEVS
jgi:hypothetical protein